MRESTVLLRMCIDLNDSPISLTPGWLRSFIELTRARPGSRPPCAIATFGETDSLWSLTERCEGKNDARVFPP